MRFVSCLLCPYPPLAKYPSSPTLVPNVADRSRPRPPIPGVDPELVAPAPPAPPPPPPARLSVVPLVLPPLFPYPMNKPSLVSDCCPEPPLVEPIYAPPPPPDRSEEHTSELQSH